LTAELAVAGSEFIAKTWAQTPCTVVNYITSVATRHATNKRSSTNRWTLPTFPNGGNLETNQFVRDNKLDSLWFRRGSENHRWWQGSL